jgi:hypothetical protein
MRKSSLLILLGSRFRESDGCGFSQFPLKLFVDAENYWNPDLNLAEMIKAPTNQLG